MKLLLFDTVLDGHHADYLTHLIEYWHEQKIEGILYIVAPQGLAGQFSSEITSNTRIKFSELTPQETDRIRDSSMVGRSFTSWNIYLKYARFIRPDHALLMYFDLFQLGFWLGRKSPCPVSGIYFRPNFQRSENASLKGRLVLRSKKFMLRRVLAKSDFGVLFCLDKSAVPEILTIAKGANVLPLSDPVKYFSHSNDPVEAEWQKLDLEKSRKVFLLFGYLDDRKGIEPVLDSLALLTPEESKRVTLVLAGPISDSFGQLVKSKIDSIHTDAQIVCLFQTFKGPAIQYLFAQSDFVLTLYQRHVGMSSIVVRAALAQKPLISSDFGYLGTLVGSSKLGIRVDSESPAAICEAFRHALQRQFIFDRHAAERLAKENTPQAFAQQIIKGISGKPER